MGLCSLLILSGAQSLEARGKKPPQNQDTLLEDPLSETDAEEIAPESQIERRDVPVDMPAKAEKVERREPAGEVPAVPAAQPAATRSETTFQPQTSEYNSGSAGGRTIEIIWVWQETRDCLWRLAKKHYGDPWKWKKIYLANRGSILDPNVIYPKQRIEIPSAAE